MYVIRIFFGKNMYFFTYSNAKYLMGHSYYSKNDDIEYIFVDNTEE